MIGALLLAACMLYPPWVMADRGVQGMPMPMGYFFIIGNRPRDLVTQLANAGVPLSFGLDVTRLLVQMGAVAAVTGAAYVVLGSRRKP